MRHWFLRLILHNDEFPDKATGVRRILKGCPLKQANKQTNLAQKDQT